MTLKKFGVITLMVLAIFAKADEWTGYTYSSVSTTSAVKGMKRIGDKINKETSGELNFRLHLGKTLQIKSADITQAVGDGIIDYSADYFFSGNVPIARVLNLPMLIENDNEWNKAYLAIEPVLIKAFKKQGVELLGGYRYPKQVIFTTFKITKLSDLKSKKIRVTSPEQGQFIKEFGGSPITLSGSEVPGALQRGVIDGVLTASAGGAKKWHEFLDYNYRFPVNYGNSVIIANSDKFYNLTKSQQDIFRKVVIKEGNQTSADFLLDEEIQMKKQADLGMKIQMPTNNDIKIAREKLSIYWGEWAKENGSEYESALSLVRKAINK